MKKGKEKKVIFLCLASGIIIVIGLIALVVLKSPKEVPDSEIVEENTVITETEDTIILDEPMLDETDRPDPTCYIYDITELHGGYLPLEALGDLDYRITDYLKETDDLESSILDIVPGSVNKDGMKVTFQCTIQERPKEILNITYDYTKSDYSFYLTVN